jgi:hypothetical protein
MAPKSRDPLDIIKRSAGRPKKRKQTRSPLEPKPPPEPRTRVTVGGPPAPSTDALDRIATSRPAATRVVAFDPGDLPESIKGKMGLYTARHVHREMILALTGNGLEMILDAIAVMRGQHIQVATDLEGNPIEAVPTLKDRAEARAWLSKHSMAETKSIEVTGADGGPIKTTSRLDLSSLSVEEMAAIRPVLKKLIPVTIDAGPESDAEIVKP